jgi:glycosyltransferase involved in cell wall biosynthesis
LKILLVMPSLEAGGAEKVAVTLVNALCVQHEVTLFAMLDRGPLFSQVNPKVRVVRAVKSGHTWWRKWLILKKLIGEARKHDVVIAGLEVTATYFAYAAAILTRKPLVAWVHTLLAEYLTLNYFSARHVILCRFLYRRIAYQVFVSEGAKTSMLQLIAPPTSCADMAVIYNPIIFSPASSETLPYLPEQPFVLGVGRLAPEKGFDLLIDAVSLLHQSGEEVALLILGEGASRPQLEAQIDALGLRSYVHLPGFVENVASYYQHAAVFALSSTIEGLSMVLLEAMQSGVPLVTTDLPSVHELLGEDADPVAQGDVKDFAAKLRKALHETESAEKKNRRKRKAESFTPDYAATLWEQVLTRALKRNS